MTRWEPGVARVTSKVAGVAFVCQLTGLNHREALAS